MTQPQNAFTCECKTDLGTQIANATVKCRKCKKEWHINNNATGMSEVARTLTDKELRGTR